MMDEERQPWDQKEGESALWYGRFNRYRSIVIGRSVAAVFREEMRGNERSEPPGRWYEESKRWKWEERASAWDAHWIKEQDEIIKSERELIMRLGFAVQHRRIQSLDKILNKLIEMTEDEDKVWLPDVKAIGNGPNAERVDLVNFNAPLFSLIDKYKASLAAEMGERVKKKDITITEMPPSVYLFNPDEDGSIIDSNETLPDPELQQNTDNEGQ